MGIDLVALGRDRWQESQDANKIMLQLTQGVMQRFPSLLAQRLQLKRNLPLLNRMFNTLAPSNTLPSTSR